MQYSPKLKKAMAEIKDILSRHDIAALVVLHTPGNAEYMLKIDPTYSCAKFEGDYLRVKARLKQDFQGNKKAKDQKVADTCNMLTSIVDCAGPMLINLMDIAERVNKAAGAEHEDGGHTSITTQNN